MDFKAEIEKIIDKVKNDDKLKENFTKDPAGTVKSLVGDKVDDDTIKKIIDTVKGALAGGALGSIGDKISDAIGGLLGGKKDDKKDE